MAPSMTFRKVAAIRLAIANFKMETRKFNTVLEWEDLSYSISKTIDGQRKETQILSNLSGNATSGELVAVLGQSGSGKTSFLNVLSYRVPRKSAARLSGRIILDGVDVLNEMEMTRVSAYTEQDLPLFTYLSVYETLLLAAKFNLDPTLPDESIQKAVSDVMLQLGLSKCADTKIGGAMARGVSGGEKKRVAIAKELFSNPKILFLDEPTSGLDSFQALSVMESMRNMTASQGRIIISVIHQPRSSIFDMCDKVFIISEGRCMYYGPTINILPYFTSTGYECPVRYNPADWLLDLLSLDTRTLEREKESQERINWFASLWIDPHGPQAHYRMTAVTLFDGSFNEGNIDPDSDKDQCCQSQCCYGYPCNPRGCALAVGLYVTRWCRDFAMLLWRSAVDRYRNWFELGILFCTTIFFAVLLSLVYSDMGTGQKSIQDRVGILFFITINQSFGPMASVLATFPDERKLVLKERVSGAYTTSSYFMARVVSEIPLNIIIPVVYVSIIYWIVGLNPDPYRYLIFIAIIVLETHCAVAVGYAISAIAPDAKAAQAIGPPVLIILVSQYIHIHCTHSNTSTN